jgi:predicted LPLAT superfamily acyltransferase
MSSHESRQKERGHRIFLVLIVWIARRLGRPLARAILRPITLYYLLFAPQARAQSRKYLCRVLPHRPRLRDVYRHLFYFASTLLDRVYLFGDQAEKLEITVYGRESFYRYRDAATGALVVVAHLGSFEILRILGRDDGDLRMQVLMDRDAGAKANAVLMAIDPDAETNLIDTSTSDVDRALKIQAVLERGEMLSLMADRYREGERTVECDFLGGRAKFPLGPWLLAGLMQAPVLLAFGLYRGGNRYEIHLEELSDRVEIPRAQRHARARQYAQRYADRLAHYTRYAPYNWFNFYDFWQ